MEITTELQGSLAALYKYVVELDLLFTYRIRSLLKKTTKQTF